MRKVALLREQFYLYQKKFRESFASNLLLKPSKNINKP